jgi:hypothetical protein
MEEEILDVLLRTNQETEKPVDEQLLKYILEIVKRNPLHDDRITSQNQIELIINQYRGGTQK